tara:strand:+ start:3228 stop:3965 length:738 start_codon:yes stop_codon:yes gene_type:complete
MEKKKRVLTPEQRERLLKQLEKGRATRKRNLEEKKKVKFNDVPETIPETTETETGDEAGDEAVELLPVVKEKKLTKYKLRKLEEDKLKLEKKELKEKLKVEKLADKEKLKEEKKALRIQISNNKKDRLRKERELRVQKKHLEKQEKMKLEIEYQACNEVDNEMKLEMIKEIEEEDDYKNIKLTDSEPDEDVPEDIPIIPQSNRIEENKELFPDNKTKITPVVHIQKPKIKKLMQDRYGNLKEVYI